MHEARALTTIPDDELLQRLAEILRDSRSTEADLVAHIGEVDRRRLYARSASPSMFRYCIHVLHLSEPEAYLRIVAARAARKHPVLLAMLADGRLHLSGIVKLAPHLTRENRDALLQRATHRSKRQIEELIAEICPRPDVPSLVRKLPGGMGQESLPPPTRLPAHGEDRIAAGVVELSEARDRVRAAGAPADRIELDQAGVSASLPSAGGVPLLVSLAGAEASSGPELRPGGVGSSRCVVEPLAPSRYKVQFTASAQLKDKLERLQALLRSEVPDGDLGAVIELAVTENLERLEARRFAKTRARARTTTAAQSSTAAQTHTITQPTTAYQPAVQTQTQARTQAATAAASTPRSSTLPSPGARGHVRHIPAAIRRAVHQRDGGRCRYVDETGRRCPERHRLEYHHLHPFGMGGGHTPENLRLICRAHNFYLAEHDYGPKAMAAYRTG
jgi:5-methylcytosine-specific restriction endonuclease McrA